MSTCERCNGSGFEDSGGVQPWGEPILVECECRLMEGNMGESRKAFESWVASTTNSDLHRSVMLDRRESGSYSHLATENKWEAWQASRAAIEIELPKKIEREVRDSDMDDERRWGHNDAIRGCAASIRAAGIKVKE